MEGKPVSNSDLEWEDLVLRGGKPLEPSYFTLSNAVGVNDHRNSSSSSKYPVSATHDSLLESRDYSKEGSLIPYESTYDDVFSMHRIGGFTEPTIGLKLGRSKEYGDSVFTKSSLPASSFTTKRSRNSYQTVQHPSCQVEGCNLDLTSAKDYHRRHRICENHSKSPKVIISGMERRFCQQCSRFHELSEFDDKKRSCRRRLSDHNARRRRVQPDSFQLTPCGLSSAFYDHSMQQHGLFNGLPISQPGAPDEAVRFPGDHFASSISTLYLDPTRNILQHGLHDPATNSPMDPHILPAPSLLSWSVNEGESPTTDGFGQRSYISTVTELNSESYTLPLHATLPHMNRVSLHDPATVVEQPLEYQLLEAPYQPGIYYHGHRNL